MDGHQLLPLWLQPYRTFDFTSPLLPGEGVPRPLTGDEILALEAGGNTSSDWSRVLVAANFAPAFVKFSRFSGSCYLGDFSRPLTASVIDLPLPAGIYNSHLHGTAVASGALVQGTALVAGYVIEQGAAIIGCSLLEAGRGIPELCRARIIPGNETGGRELPILPEMPLARLTAAVLGSTRAAGRDAFRQDAETLAAALAAIPGVVGRESRLAGCGPLRDCLFGPGTVVDGAATVSSTLCLSLPDAPCRIESGAVVRASVLRPGTEIGGHAVVLASYLAEGVEVEEHARVHASYLGEHTAVGGGEVTSCLVGPHVAMHHSSLLIAALWPDGHGNIGYGANVGSNHTGRAPDQELLVGEGCFFGLSCCVKFPADLREAAGSIIATGVVVPPGRIRYPLSLIQSDPAGPPRIKPGWVFSANAYALARNQQKYLKRGGTPVPLVSLAVLQAAAVALEVLEQGDAASFAGGCALAADDIRLGVEAYRGLLRYGVAEHGARFPDSALTAALAAGLADSAGYDRETCADPARLETLYREERQRLLAACGQSRERDFRRGMEVQGETYPESHPALAEDPVLLALAAECAAF